MYISYKAICRQGTLALVDDGLHAPSAALPGTLPGAQSAERRRMPLGLRERLGQVLEALQHLKESSRGACSIILINIISYYSY